MGLCLRELVQSTIGLQKFIKEDIMHYRQILLQQELFYLYYVQNLHHSCQHYRVMITMSISDLGTKIRWRNIGIKWANALAKTNKFLKILKNSFKVCFALILRADSLLMKLDKANGWRATMLPKIKLGNSSNKNMQSS